jgi:hypothetical protein
MISRGLSFLEFTINHEREVLSFGPLVAKLRRAFPNANIGDKVRLDFYKERVFTTPLEAHGKPAVRTHPLGREVWAELLETGWHLAFPLEANFPKRKPQRPVHRE